MRGLKRFVQVITIIVIATAVHGQASQRLRDRDPDLEGAKKLAAELQQANFHWGDVYLLSRIRLSDAGFSETASLPTGQQSGGINLSIEAPNRFYYVPTKKTIFTFDVTPGYSFFRAGDREGQFNYIARADAHFLWNHLYLDVYALREDQLRAHVADINRLATIRNDEVGVAGEAKYSSRTSALFTVRLRDIEYPERRFQPEDILDRAGRPLLDDLLDRQEKNGRVSVMHKTLPLTSFFVAAERNDYTFDRSTYKDSTRSWLGAGAIYNSGRTTVRVEGGPVKLDFDDPAQPDYSGIHASLAATRESGRRAFTFNADRDLGFSVFANNNYFISTVLRAGVTHVATRKLTLRAGSTWERDDYDTEVSGRDRRDTISFSSVGFIYTLQRLAFGADIGWYERTSTVGGDEDSGIRTVLHLSFTP